MSGGLNGYVERARGGQVPQASQAGNHGQPRILNQQNASVPRVAVPPTTRSNIAQARNVTSMQPPARGKAMINGQPLDSFAPTDYTGSTTSTVSKIQVRDSQAPVSGHYDARHQPNGASGIGDYADEDGEETGSDEEEDDEEDDDEGASDDGVEEQQNPVHQQPQQQFQYGQPAMRQQAQQAAMNQQQFKRSPFDAGDSYPPTTAGNPEDEESVGALSRLEELQQPGPAQHAAPLYSQSNRGADLPAQSLYRQAPTTHQQAPFTQHQPPLTQQETASARFFPKSSQLQSQGQANIPLRQSSPSPKPFTQPKNHLNPAAVLGKSRPGSAPQAPQPGSNLNPKTRPILTGFTQAPAAQLLASVARIVQEPQTVDEPVISVEEEPQLDYSENVLKGMNYEELRNEDYDMDPSNPPSVLPTEEQTRPLPERLESAQRLQRDYQRQFFASLTLTEWEEAGDWFLEKFGDAVKKMTESRKEKRKLAMDFEAEIAKRHEHVDSRKRGIDEALMEMSNNGRNVLRGSTPKRQRVAGEGT